MDKKQEIGDFHCSEMIWCKYANKEFCYADRLTCLRYEKEKNIKEKNIKDKK